MRISVRGVVAPVLGLALALGVPAAITAKPGGMIRQDAAPLRLPGMPLHDPWIVVDRATGTYHLFTRNEAAMTGDPRLGIMAYTSRDLKRWTRPRLVFAAPTDMWANDGAWAPEVHRWKGRWYMFATFHNEGLAVPGQGPRALYRRGTVLAVADRLDGPFALVRDGAPIVPPERMTLDGSLHVDRAGRPWLVYAHEWIQSRDGTIEAVPLDDTLKAMGPSRTLFHASDAPWADGKPQKEGDTIFVTDGPETYRTRDGHLLMLWSSYDRTGYVQGLARSKSGGIEGPWEQLPPLVRADSGHGMLFRDLGGRLLMVLHRPFTNARGKLYLMRDTGDTIAVARELTELDGETRATPR